MLVYQFLRRQSRIGMRLCQRLGRQGRHRYEALGLSGSEETEKAQVCGLESVSI